MAANVKWKSSGTGDLDTAANYNPAQVPVDTDWIWFDAAGQALVSGLNQATVDPAELIVTKDFTESLGTAGSYLTYGNIGTFRFEGQASSNNKLKAGWITDTHILDALQLSVDANFTNLFIQKGIASFLKTGGGTVTRAIIGKKDNVRTDVTATFASTLSIGHLIMFGGAVETNNAITLAVVADGILTHKGSSKITALVVLKQGKVIYEASQAPDILIVGPGAEGNFTTNGGPLTLAKVVLFDGGKLDLRNGQANIEFSAADGFVAYGYAYPFVDQGVALTTITL